MPFTIVRNDITNMTVDAIVNTANPLPVIGDGIDRAIHEKAGPRLLAARKEIGTIDVGQAAVTPACNLDAKYVIHTVGPMWIDGNHNEEALLEACYQNSLKLALVKKCKSVAFPLVSTGTYGFPKGRALQIATKVISRFVLNFDMMVYLVVFDKASYSLSEKLAGEVKSYIDNNYVGRQMEEEYRHDIVFSASLREEIALHKAAPTSPKTKAVRTPLPPKGRDMEGKAFYSVGNHWADFELEETFSQMLLQLIDEKGMTHAEAYNKANIDKKHFHKIKNNINYKPTKYTVLAFAIALELTLAETKELMETAGLALSKSNLFDVIVSFFIENKRYDVFELNDVLFEYDLPLLGC
ncbi:MAG: macro domain-containing protein [Oscillospiraceae bacterium]|nr:macro domain-containing protein [Oscillospiraceae bacterium]